MAHDRYKEHEKTFFQDDTEFLSRMSRYYLLDAIRCEMHNEGYALDGNTEESDVRWLARIIFDNDGREPGHWDVVHEDVRERYMKLAELLMSCIPRLMSRISSRCIRISQAANSAIKAEKLDKWYEKQREHPERKL
jgi:hypothetical protein